MIFSALDQILVTIPPSYLGLVEFYFRSDAMTFLIGVMSFANFVFYPLVVGAIIAVIIEQILRARGDEDVPKDVKNVMVAMGIRKYLIRQAWIFNIIWFIGYFILMFTIGRQQPASMPDMLWQG